MHRSTTTFLSFLHQRVPIALAHPLLEAAYAPKFTRDVSGVAFSFAYFPTGSYISFTLPPFL
jgi:hypothetical protein